MVVLVLISLMTAVIVPEMQGSYGDALLRSQARELLSTLNLAYSRSVSINQAHRVRFDKIAGRYFLERRVRQTESQSIYSPIAEILSGDGRINPRISFEVRQLGGMPSTPTTPSTPTDSGEETNRAQDVDTITFYPDGTATDREIVLEDRDGFRLSLQVNPVTARIKLVAQERKR